MSSRLPITPVLALLLIFTSPIFAQDDVQNPTSNNREITVVPTPGPVTIDGSDKDWDLSAGIWSYNDPTLVKKYSVWTHAMWDEKGIYLLCRYADLSPMKNATRGKDFSQSWRADAFQGRLIFDDKTPEEHQMHINMFYSSSEQKPYIIVHHGGLRSKPPYDGTGPERPDQLEKYGVTMDAFGGKIAFRPWDDGQGYNMEAFWPWGYLRTSGKPLKAGDSFIFGIEDMWGSSDGTSLIHRLVDNMKNDKVNRIFFFRARDGWGRAVLSDKGNLGITAAQKALQAARLKQFINYDTQGPVAITYTLPDDRDVTIAIDNAQGVRVRNLIGQYPRSKGTNTDFWDGLDDKGSPLPPGEYTVRIVDHAPITVRLYNSLYNAATPPWSTDKGARYWGSNHGHPTTVATRGDVTIIGFTGTEGTSGVLRTSPEGIIQWSDSSEILDATIGEKYVYTFSRESYTNKVLLRRFDIQTGKLVLFDDADHSPASLMDLAIADVPDTSTVAVSAGKLYVFVPAKGLFIIDASTGKTASASDIPGLIAVNDRDENLTGLFADGTVARLDFSGKPKAKVFTAHGLIQPARLAESEDGARFAISDIGTNQVFVYDAKGTLLKTLGQAYAAVDGQRPPGKFIDTNFIKPLGLDFDAKGQLWIAESVQSCRRITRWNPEGQLLAQYWGSADYGAMAGFPFTQDSTRFIAFGVEFKLDPHPDIYNRPTAETPLVFHPELSKTRGLIYSYKGHEYAVSVPGYNKQDYVIIAKRNAEGVFKTVVRIDYASGGKKAAPGSVWTDLNDNGIEDPGETVAGFQGNHHYWSNGWMRPDLTFITPDQLVYRLKGLSPTGVPLYDFKNPEKLPNAFRPDFRSNGSGTVVMDDAGNVSDGINFATVDGHTGSYPNLYGRHDAPAAHRGLLIAPFRSNGIVEKVPGVGSITAIGGDRGEWFLMSTDGIYLSSILQDSKGDVTLDETFVGQESFGGFIWRDEKGRVLAQLGGASYRLVEILGLDTTRQQTMKLRLTDAQIAEGVKLSQTKTSSVTTEPEALIISRAILPKDPVSPDAGTQQSLIDGVETVRVQESGDATRWFRVALGQDGKNLAVAWQVNDANPWKNGEGRFTHAFIGGDCVDLQLDVPGRGLVRLLAAPIAGTNTVVYWQKTATVKENPSTYMVANNTANAQNFDIVKRLASAKVAVSVGLRGYSVLLTVPLADLGLNLVKTPELKGIVGVIFSDPSGTNRASRLYWHDKSTGLVSDVPSEARLDPTRWGRITLGK